MRLFLSRFAWRLSGAGFERIFASLVLVWAGSVCVLRNFTRN